MGLTHVTVALKSMRSQNGKYEAEPILGVTALESVGITIDPATRTLKRLPAIPLKLLCRVT